jgi:2-polyprenyl-3-methyl-5-hydroxy-6-metoxy-1,4-benzoquinol methylase
MAESLLDKLITEDGEWTAMAVKLSDGTYTRKIPLPDHRLRRLVQVAADVMKKPLSECRVLDLACLEGHYAIEFAMHGAEAVGIEGREISIRKCNFTKNDLGLNNLSFFQDDVRNLSIEKYGHFDIVICSGILYHLKASDLPCIIQAMADVCTGILLLDTFIALSSQTTQNVDGVILHGHHYFEHSSDDKEQTKQEKLWASIDNASSFWLTAPSIVNQLMHAGFTSVSDILTPNMPGNMVDRKTYLCIKGKAITVLSTDVTNKEPMHDIVEGRNTFMDASQTPKSKFFLMMKGVLPQAVKNAVKPVLRLLGFLPPDPTPDFLKKKSEKVK